MPKAKILIVEDEKIVALDIQKSVESMGYFVCAIASSGEEAVQKAGETQPDLTLMDIVLKGEMDGIRAAEQINALFKIPIVYLTAYDDEDILQRAKITTPYGYIIKPFNDRELRIAIEVALYKNQAEAKIRKTELWLATVLRSVGDAVIASDKEGQISFMNQVAETLTGLKKEDALGKKLTEVLNIKDELGSLEKHLVEKVIIQGLIINLLEDRLLVAKDGTEIPVSDSVSPIRDDNGETAGSVLVFKDNTQHLRAEEALRQSEARYRHLVEYAPAAIYEVDLTTGRFLSVNEVLCEYSGYTQDELLALNPLDLMTEESQKLIVQRMAGYAAGEPVPPTVEYKARSKSGREFWVSVNAKYFYQAGLPVRATMVAYDITERKRMEEALRESEELFRSYLENAPDGIYMNDLEGNFLFGNRKCEEITGYRREELIGKNFLELNLLSENSLNTAVRLLQANMEGKSTGPDEIEIISKNGCIIPIEINTNVVQRMAQRIIIASVRDITERKKAEESLKKTLDSLRKAVGATIQVMVSAVETRDPYTAGHQIRSADLARTIATEMGLPQEKIDAIRMAGSIHDIGKLSIPAEILSKPKKLSDIEFRLIQEHARRGYEILKDVESPWPLAEIVYQHHERMDGSGYPRNLKGEEILIEARILTVADVVEAMASHRPYRPGLGIDTALNEIEKNRGIFYDNTVAAACLRLFREKGFQIT